MAVPGVSLDIVLDRKTAKFQAGEAVSGHVVISLSSGLPVTGIEVRLSGICRIEWDQRKWWNIVKSQLTGQNQAWVDYSTEKLIKREQLLLGVAGEQAPSLPNTVTVGATEYDPSRYNITIQHLAAGDHKYPMSLSLPHNIPGSFHTEKGDSILYDVTVTVWSQPQSPLVVSKKIHVDCVFNLNLEPEFLKPVLCYKELQIGPPCCASRFVSGEFRLAKQGVIPGEQLFALCEIDNRSSIPIQDVQIVIRQYVRTFGPGGQRSFKDLSKMKLGGINSQDKRVWENVNISLPRDMVPGRHWCKTLVVKHVAMLVAKPAHWPKHLKVPIQLFVGTIMFSHTTQSHHRSLVKLNSSSSPTSSRRSSGTSSVPIAGTPRSSTLKSTRRSVSSLCSHRESVPRLGGPCAQDIVTALQRVRKHARAESLGTPTYENMSSRRSSGIGPLDGPGSRRGTMSSQGGPITRKPPKAPVSKRRSDSEINHMQGGL